MRKLALHASALNDAEYDLYTESLKEIVLGDCDEDSSPREGDDAYYERMTVGIREARAWLRGRYSSLSAGVIDRILRLFSPTLAAAGTLSGEEFFAALRLVVHAESGKEPERSLVFSQAHPTSSSIHESIPAHTVPTPSTTPAKSTPSPRKRPAHLPPPPPLPLSRRPNADIIPPSPTRAESFNPFSSSTAAAQSHSHPQPPLHPSQRPPSSSSTQNVAPVTSEITVSALKSHTAHNPFVARPSALSTRSEDAHLGNHNTSSRSGKLPPLPPRKPAGQYSSVPVGSSSSVNGDNVSISGVTSVSASTSKSQPPPPPPPRHASSRSRTERSLSPSKIQHTASPVPVPVPVPTPANTFPPPLDAPSTSMTSTGPPPKPPKPPQLGYTPSVSSTASASAYSYTTAHTSPASFGSKIGANSGNSTLLGSKLGTGFSVLKPAPPVPGSSHHHSGVPSAAAPSGAGIHTSTLIKQSLQASKVASAVKKAEEQLEKERVMRVLKSSSAGSSSGAGVGMAGGGPVAFTSSESGSEDRERRSQGPPLPKRRHHHQQQVQQPSPPMSTSSLEQVAMAGSSAVGEKEVSRRRVEEGDDRERMRDGEEEREWERERVKSDPPPVHPGRRGSYHRLVAQAALTSPPLPASSGGTGAISPFEAVYGTGVDVDEPEAFGGASKATPFNDASGGESPTTPNQNPRVWRSKSLHHPSPPASSAGAGGGRVGGLVPPPKRKRPESVQVLPGSSSTISGMFGGMSIGKGYGSGVGSRSPSASRDPSVAPGYSRVGGGGGMGMSHNRRSSLSATPSAMTTSAFSSNSTSTPVAGGGGPSTTTMQLSDSFHRTLASIQPKLDQARYKAEAGLSRRGYIKTNTTLSGGVNGMSIVGRARRPSERRREDRESREGLMGSDEEDEERDDELEETRARLRACGTDDEAANLGAKDVRGGVGMSPSVKKGRRRSALGPSYDSSDGGGGVDDDDDDSSDDAFVDAPEGTGVGMSGSGLDRGRERRSSNRDGYGPALFDGGPFESSSRKMNRDSVGAGMDDGWRPL
ncbi:hypothetical protein CVT24_001082 [Panaeolus cyanescens]|uniref:Uncharacterized protein n=1 Tax=Panaeolus cyanescens TaxID=181874 RepID=A0A409WBM9_9AGAR|nr:hypothetical protein CVT24_001082 [Panaeolus cyanescens]